MDLTNSLKGMFNRLDFQNNIPKEKKYTPYEMFETYSNRLNANGGHSQYDRMVFDKRRSLDRALKYSYQSCTVRRISCEGVLTHPGFQEIDEHELCRVLINPNKLKMDYDEKIISVHYEENIHAGDIIEWVGTDSYWICYLQDLDEKAYFRGSLRRCSYQINWQDEEGLHSTYAAVRGPVETKINYVQKHQASIDTPNHSLNIYLPRNKETMSYFRRYSKFYLGGQDEGSPNVCWRVEATDWISTPGILEITAVEYYANETEDDLEKGLVGSLITQKINPNEDNEIFIAGETFIKPNTVNDYYFNGLNDSSWKIIDEKAPVKLGVDPNDPLHIRIKWLEPFSGQFKIKYGEYEKTIVVESLF